MTGVELDDGDDRAPARSSSPRASTSRGSTLPEHARVPVRPVKGQVLRLRDPGGPGLVERTIRGEQAYLVPRGDGRYVLGATMEERGWDTTPTAGGVYELLRDLSEIVPGVFELEIEELHRRPAPGDARQPARDRPPARSTGLVWATGHFRNGILLTPVTADLVAGALAGEPLPDWAARRRPAAASREVPRMNVVLNGEPAELRRRRDGRRPRSTRSTCPARGRGVAVAVDAEVVPRGQWAAHQLHEGARVEILRAIQGG